MYVSIEKFYALQRNIKTKYFNRYVIRVNYTIIRTKKIILIKYNIGVIK